jgi:hypothetical protein
MTTGQKGLRALAENAREVKLEESREQARDRRKKSLQAVIERYPDRYRGFGRLAEEGLTIPDPSENDFEYVKDVRIFSGVADKSSGWKVVIDEVPFLFGDSYRAEALFVIHACPKCGVEGASTFHGLDDLGKLLKFGPANYQHHCLEKETLDVARVIGAAARDLGLSANNVVDEAFNRHSDVISRLMSGR